MQTKHKEVLEEVFNDVAEKLAFMFSEPVEKTEMPTPETECVLAKMSFRGPLTGRVALASSVELCPLIAANVLGMEPDDEGVEARGADALQELLNVICGNALTAVGGEQAVFDLTVPEMTSLTPEAWNELADDSDTLAFIMEDYPVLLQFKLDGRSSE